MKTEITDLLKRASKFECAGAKTRQAGNESKAETLFREAYDSATKAAKQAEASNQDRVEILKATARLALRCGETAQARQLIDGALASDTALVKREDWALFCDVREWPDEWLLAAARQESPDEAALEALVQRHWKALYGRCWMLTLNPSDAADLAQSTWCRVLQTRQRLNPGKRFGAYLSVIATNLWRDLMRSANRAGLLAEHRLLSLDQALPGDDESSITLKDALPDLPYAHDQERRHLAMDIDQALAELSPVLRDVLVARFVAGESCAEIGRRLGRAEQTISGWVRKAIRRMKLHFEDHKFAANEGFNHEKKYLHCNTASQPYSKGRTREKIEATSGGSML